MYAASPSIPNASGVGLRAPHHDVFAREKPEVAWLEVHSENYFSLDGLPCDILQRIRADYPISLHGVGLSLGSVDPIDSGHLNKLKGLIDRIEPGMVSEHLSWSSVDGHHSNDLLPLPHSEESIQHLTERIQKTQDFLGRSILIENVSSYVEFRVSEMPEWQFVNEIARRSGARVLLDINNIFVNSQNHNFSAEDYIENISVELVAEMHLAGHSRQTFNNQTILVDTHDAPVCDDVWQLYELAARRFGPTPTLVEWDSKLPSVATLINEANKAQKIQDAVNEVTA